MSSHHMQGVYAPEILKVMGDALDRAWKEFKPRPKNAELARLLMTSAIIDAVEAGAAEATILADKATRALSAAIGEDREALVAVGACRVGRMGPLLAFPPSRSASPWSVHAA